MQPGTNQKFQNEHTILIAILLLALVNGLLYIFIVPPWQHYDEPNHFEVVWLLAERGERPKPGESDTGMRRDVARSMIAHGFYDGWGEPPDLTSEKPWIGGYSQMDEPPLYYWLASIPQCLLGIENVTFQLYAARLVSLTLFLVTIFAGYGLVAEITPARHPLRFLVPLTMALLPAFVDLMTSVNNDVGAIAVFSLFLWGCVRLVRRGPSWPILMWVLIACALCLFTKRTVYLALPLLGVALLFAFLRGKYRVLAWGVVILSGIALVLVVFSWGDAALWYRDTPQNFPTRAALPDIPEGEFAFRLSIQPGDPPAKLVQILPTELARRMSAKSYTLGAWIWASQPVEINTAQLNVFDGNQVFVEKIRVTETPQFFAFTFSPQGNTQRTWVLLQPSISLDIENPVNIYYDGVVLAESQFRLDQAPQFAEDGLSGTWGGVPFENLLRNGSAESSWLYLRSWAEQLGNKVFSDRETASLTIYSLIDLPSTSWYYRFAAENLFRTFWAKFGWNHVSLSGAKPYRNLVYFSLAGLLGFVWAFWQRRSHLKRLPWDVMFFLGFALVSIWGLVLLRGANYVFTPVYWPIARYAYPVIIPTVLILSMGWYTLLASLGKWLRMPAWGLYVVYFGILLIINIYSLISIVGHYT